MGVIMRDFFILLAFAGAFVLAGGLLVASCVDKANSIEPTTLEDALERPVKVQKYVDKVQKYVDKENSVVCYWQPKHPQSFDCVYVPSPGLTWRNKRILNDSGD
jgi:hypothetical protein